MMQELLTQMGNHCQYRETYLVCQDFYRQKFNRLFSVNPEQAEAYRNRFMFWTHQVREINSKIKKLHSQINNFSESNNNS